MTENNKIKSEDELRHVSTEPALKNKLTVLLLDDEQVILKSLTRVLRYDYDVVSFEAGADALAYLENKAVSIIISDMRMPEMDGVEFLSKAKAICPDSIRFLLTGYSDIDSTIRAVNEGGIYTYIAKPWDNEALKLTISKAAEVLDLQKQKTLLTSQLEIKNKQLSQLNISLEEKVAIRTQKLREANEGLKLLVRSRSQAFKDILSALGAIIEHATGHSQSNTQRIAEIAKLVAKKMELSEQQITQVFLSSLLHEIGLIGQTERKTDFLGKTPHKSPVKMINDPVIQLIPQANSEIGGEIINQIKRFHSLVEIIKHQDESYDGTGIPSHLSGEDIPVGARILRLVKNYDFFVASPDNLARVSPKTARAFLQKNAGKLYDPKITEIFLKVLIKDTKDLDLGVCVGVDELQVGALIKQDVRLSNGNLMVAKGQVVNEKILSHLKAIEQESSLPLALFV